MKVLFHLFVVCHFVFAIWYDVTYVWPPTHEPKDRHFGDKTKFLTFLNINLQMIYFFLAFLNDVIGGDDSSGKGTFIRKIKDAIFCSMALPEALFVGTSFWSLFMIDRELVFPKYVDAYFPWWLNHMEHTNIIIFIFIELITTFRMYPDRKSGLILLSTFMFSYVAWVNIVYFMSGIWAYPILELLNWPLRGVFHLAMTGYTAFLYIVGEKLNSVIWGKQIQKVVKGSKKKIR